MNASRRICCNAANAFRPSTALKSVFYEPIGRRCLSTTTIRRQPETNQREGVVHSDVSQQGQRPEHGQPKAKKIADAQGFNDEFDVLPDEEVDPSLFGQDQEVVDAAQSHAPSPENASEQGSDFQSAKLAAIARKKLAGKKEELEYEGQYVEPAVGPWKYSRLPWTGKLDTKLDNRDVPAQQRLGQEIEAFYDWIRPTDAEIAAREALIKKTTNVIKKHFETVEVEAFGSSRNGLTLASSDVDLRLVFKEKEEEIKPSWLPKEGTPTPPKWEIRRRNTKLLRKVQKVFEDHPDYMFSTLRHARYPLLHMQHKPSGIDVQVVCANDTTVQREYIRKALQRQPQIAQLYAVMKMTLDCRGLTDVYRGGLGSYAIFIMTMAALKRNLPGLSKKLMLAEGTNDEIAKTDTNPHDQLGRDFLKVLNFWHFLSTYEKAIVVEPFALLPKIDPVTGKALVHNPAGRDAMENTRNFTTESPFYRELRTLDPAQPYLLCLIDPTDPTNDLGRQAYGWKHMQTTLERLNHYLLAKMWPNYKHRIQSFLGDFVGTTPKELEKRRWRVLQYGRLMMPKSLNGTIGETGSGAKVKLVKNNVPAGVPQYYSKVLNKAVDETSTVTPEGYSEREKNFAFRGKKKLRVENRKWEGDAGPEGLTEGEGVAAACVTLPPPVQQQAATLEEQGKAVATA